MQARVTKDVKKTIDYVVDRLAREYRIQTDQSQLVRIILNWGLQDPDHLVNQIALSQEVEV